MAARKIFGIKFQGGSFSEETSVEFFSKDNESVCAIYGRNGTGKSTIARAVKLAAGQEAVGIHHASFIDKMGYPIYLEELPNDFVHVFNEEYIQQNIQFRQKGLNTIVVFGPQKDVDERIHDETEKQKGLSRKRQAIIDELAKYNDEAFPLSPSYQEKILKKLLSGDDHWSGRERLIWGKKRNENVNTELYEKIMHHIPRKSEDEAVDAYKEKWALFESVRAVAEPVSEIHEMIPNFTGVETTVRELLAKKLERPELTERERYLLSLLDEGKSKQLEEMQENFADKDTTHCPFCLQPVSAEYRIGLEKSIRKILSKEVERHKRELQQTFLCAVEIPFSRLEGKLAIKAVTEGQTILKALNHNIESCNQLIQRKMGNPYESIDLPNLNLEKQAILLRSVLEDINQQIKVYNQSFYNKVQLQRTLQELNQERAYYEIMEVGKSWQKQKKEKYDLEKERDAINEELEASERIIAELMGEKKSVYVACNLINRYLRYIFGTKNRLSIYALSEEYYLLANGKPVRPSEISTGERNVLALCYFFASLFKDSDVNDLDQKQLFILLDDPISSFDSENHIGVISFFSMQINDLLVNKLENRLVVLTHDLATMHYLQKMLEDLFYRGKQGYVLKELDQQKLQKFQWNSRQEYSALLLITYQYACADQPKNDVVVGNALRRIMEAFTMFSYGKTMRFLSKKNVLSQLLAKDQQKYVPYFQNLMTRLVMNEESHMEDRVRAGSGPMFFVDFSVGEKQRIIREALCLLYLINKEHIISHLTEGKDVQNEEAVKKQIDKVFQGWCESIQI